MPILAKAVHQLTETAAQDAPDRGTAETGRQSPEEIATNTWIAEHYVERSLLYRQGLKTRG